MSIPPLVCSTPPPPDQCEDDRDTEDFDIHYNLSQDDEDDVNDFNYGTYSEFMYPTSTSTNQESKWSPQISEKADDKLPNDLVKKNTDSIGVLPEGYSSTVHKVSFEEIVIEDLNLTVEDQNDMTPKDDISNVNKCDSKTTEIDSSNKQKDTFMDVKAVIDTVEGDGVIASQDFAESNYVTIDNDEKKFEENTVPYVGDNTSQDIIHGDIIETGVTEIESRFEVEVVHSPPSLEINLDRKTADVLESELKENEASPLESKLDDFEDFDNFQFIASDNNPPSTIEYCDNPWDSEASKDCEFGNFTANFAVDESNQHIGIEDFHINRTETKQEETQLDNTDDFGDFNDFKSSVNDERQTEAVIKRTIQNDPSQSVPVLNIYTPESEAQIIESINTVLNSIFTSEISEVESTFEGNLESLLSETWGHLVNTDVRQPYIVHWNNSLGQKSLLKALCIDSRNILFGPKWQNGMPKYAVNLTVAPLQPQKPFTATNTVNEDQNIEKNTNKETASWTDPFTCDGQEYTYAEALLLDLEHLMATLDQMAHKHSSFKISDLLTHACNTEGGSSAAARPTNLDAFPNVTPPEVNKIYSSALSVQPIRQINLPDTHIFTPTDSETPRSKTIHYDQGSAVLVPQPSEDIHKNNETMLKPKNDVSLSTLEKDDDYWEFQDFKGSSSSKNIESQAHDKSSEIAINSSAILSTASYQPQILQPIKVEPVMPALNWPAPGEVKETFDDFSDFVSSTQWTDSIKTAKQTDSINTFKQTDTINTFKQPDSVNTAKLTDSQLNSDYKEESLSKINTLDDDFETFQSAPPLKSSVAPSDKSYQITSNINNNFDEFPQQFMNINEIHHVQHSKNDSINTFKPKEKVEPLTTIHNSPTTKNNIKFSPVLSTRIESMNTVLQPTIPITSSSHQIHKKTGQILQPLTLESFSQINWPNPGIDLQDLSRFNPVESLQSLKSDVSTGGSSRVASPAHKDTNATRNDISDDDIWGDFVSSRPKQQQSQIKKLSSFADEDEWTDFVSSPSVKPQNGLNTISLNVHTNSNMQKTSGQGKYPSKTNPISLDIPTLNYVTPKSSNRGLNNDKHFQNL